jgi:hypothetical protein
MANNTVKLVVCAIWVGVGAVVSVIAAGLFRLPVLGKCLPAERCAPASPFFPACFAHFRHAGYPAVAPVRLSRHPPETKRGRQE